jgi:hypothetical protein
MIQNLLASMHAHPTWWTIGGYYLFSNFVSSLPTPLNKSSFYGFFFDFVHLTAGNLGRIIATRYPQTQPIEKPNA